MTLVILYFAYTSSALYYFDYTPHLEIVFCLSPESPQSLSICFPWLTMLSQPLPHADLLISYSTCSLHLLLSLHQGLIYALCLKFLYSHYFNHQIVKKNCHIPWICARHLLSETDLYHYFFTGTVLCSLPHFRWSRGATSSISADAPFLGNPWRLPWFG